MSIDDLSWSGRTPPTRNAEMRRIIREVAERERLPEAALLGRCATRRVSWPRQEAYFRCRHELRQSFPQIAALFGRDHQTVIHGVRAHAERMQASA